MACARPEGRRISSGRLAGARDLGAGARRARSGRPLLLGNAPETPRFAIRELPPRPDAAEGQPVSNRASGPFPQPGPVTRKAEPRADLDFPGESQPRARSPGGRTD